MARRTGPTEVARYALFGERMTADDPEFIHIEEVRTRSRLYGWRIAPHIHPRMFQIVHIVDGGARVEMEGHRETVVGPCSITVPGGAVHGFEFAPDTAGFVVTAADRIVLDADRRTRGIFEALMAEPRIVDFANVPSSAAALAALLAQMMHEFSAGDVGRAPMLDWMLRIALLTVSRQAHAATAAIGAVGCGRQTFQRLARLIEDNYRAHWSTKDYAAAMAMSPARLHRICLSFAGRGTQEIAHARLTLEAQRLLTYTSATSAMVAYELGFQDPAYFTRFFRRRTGQTPNRFRRAARGAGATAAA